ARRRRDRRGHRAPVVRLRSRQVPRRAAAGRADQRAVLELRGRHLDRPLRCRLLRPAGALGMPPPAASDLALQEQVPTTEAQRRRLLFGVLGPPLAWFAQLQANYALVPWVCAHGHRSVLLL